MGQGAVVVPALQKAGRVRRLAGAREAARARAHLCGRRLCVLQVKEVTAEAEAAAGTSSESMQQLRRDAETKRGALEQVPPGVSWRSRTAWQGGM